MKNIKCLAEHIANEMNYINNNMFTTEEMKESVKEYTYQLEHEKSTLIDMLKEEYQK